MKNIIMLLTIPLLFSCHANYIETPDSTERQLYNEVIHVEIASAIEEEIKADRKILISGNSQSVEQFDLLKYLLPVLHDRKILSMGFWFLKGNSDLEILKYLRDDKDALTESELLFNTDPVLCGFQEYADFLVYMKDFYSNHDQPNEMVITDSDKALVYFDLYQQPGIRDERYHFMIHTPILLPGNHYELPFAGKLYYMMIHDWPLNHYNVLNIKGTILEDQFLTSSDRKLDITAGMIADALILLGYPESFSPLKKIDEFINEGNVSEALQSFPRQIIRKKVKPASYLVNKKVDRIHRNKYKKIEKEYERIRMMLPVLKE